MLKLDHVAVGCTELAQGVAWVEAKLGVTLQPGGKHLRFGTHNMLLGLGPGLYLEVIAPDPDAAPFDGPRWFNLDNFNGPPRLTNWICQTREFHSIAGPSVALSRGDLNWQITVPADGRLPYEGAYPTLIKWGEDSDHPADRLDDSGCRLTEFEVHHPDEELPRRVLIDDPRVRFVKGVQGFWAVFDTPHGRRVLS